MLAELRSPNQAIKTIEVGDHLPDQIAVGPEVQVRWGNTQPKVRVYRLDRIEPPSGVSRRAIYVPASD